MKNTFTEIIFFVLLYSPFLWRGGSEVQAQNYPLHINTQLVAPFSGYLPDYTNAGEEKLKLFLLFNDFTKPSYNIKLKISIHGQGINIQSKSSYFEGPITVYPGVPLELSGSEIEPLLNSHNLDFSGISKTQYEQHKILPEGFYTFCITAYDYNNPIPIQVSNVSCAQGWLVLSDPPFLNLPVCGSVLTTSNPQQATFSFTQMNMGSPNSAANTEYLFELWEIRPQGAVPNNIVQTVPPIFTYTTNLTTINYGITEPPLLKGMQYAWRVKAFDITGRDLFKNNGYSQVCTFTYGNIFDGTNINLNLHAQGVSQRQIKIWWDSLALFTSYKVEYRKAGSNGNWFPVTTSNCQLRVLDLEPQTTYEVHIQGINENYASPFSTSVSATTLAMPNYQCGELPFVPNSSQFQPLKLATTNMMWQVGQFEMKVTDLQYAVSPLGIYSGFGKITMPYGMSVRCSFTNVQVNSEQVIVQGKVIALTDGVDEWLSSHGVGTIQNGTVEPEIHINYPLSTSDIHVNTSNGTFTIGGTTYTYSPSGATIEDGNGTLFIVTTDGQVINAGTAGSGHGPVPESKNIINTSQGQVAFKADAAQLYGLDEYTHVELIHYYLTVKNITDNSHPPVNWKSVLAKKYDVIDLEYQLTGGLKPDSILFRTGTGTIYKPQGSGTTRKLYIIGGDHGDVQELFACYKVRQDSFINIAKINIASYRNEQNKVTLVPLGNNISIDKTQLQKQLNEIYKQSVATWVVDVAPPITVGDTMWDKDGNGKLNVGSSLFTRYSSETRAINKYIRSQTYYNAGEYYLVVTNKPTDSLSAGLQGEMPRGAHIGYIFTGSPSAHLIAHELGHGAFILEHSFDGNATLPQGSSACLMDYNNGSELYKGKYWDYVHNPTTVIGMFEDDSQGADLSDDYHKKKVFDLLGKIRDAYKNNTSVALLPGIYNIYFIKNVYVNGIHYDNIDISSNNLSAQALFPQGKITESTCLQHSFMTGKDQTVPCIDIAGVLKIVVAEDKIKLLKAFLVGTVLSRNLILFVNGYRNNAPSFDELPKGDDDVSEIDKFNYWANIDASFINRIGTRNAIYADGHHSVNTSNHKGQENFILNLAEWKCTSNLLTPVIFSSFIANAVLPFSCYQYYHDDTKFKLHSTANGGGFSTRRANGSTAGQNLLNKLNNGTIYCRKNQQGKIQDTIDVVCHSMGYAYALGMIDKFKEKEPLLVIGRLYCLAPENAGSGPINRNNFQEVWQYGSNDQTGVNNEVWKLDGVAPQTAIPGLSDGQRAYIPDDGSVPRGFLESHYIENYWWIFNKIEGQKGYVKPRK